jgi:hypothetical protein
MRSLSSGARSRDPLANPPYGLPGRIDFIAKGMSPSRAECLDAFWYDGLLGRYARTFSPFHRRVITADALEVGASGEGDNRDHLFSAFRAVRYPIHEILPIFRSSRFFLSNLELEFLFHSSVWAEGPVGIGAAPLVVFGRSSSPESSKRVGRNSASFG